MTAQTMPSTGSGADFAAMLQRIAGMRLVCIGDVMLDRFVRGRVERLSPEAPIPVLAIEGELELPGGAANVARNLAALGVSVELFGVIGQDADGARLKQLLREEFAIEPQLLALPGRRTTVKTRFMAGAHQLLRSDSESLLPLPSESQANLKDRIEAALAKADAVVLSDYGKGIFAGGLAGHVIAAAKRRGVLTAVDPRGADWSRYRGADLVTPNRRELTEAAGAALSTLAEAERAARALLMGHKLGAVLVTLSEQGMLLVEDDGARHLPADRREVADVTGAGDTAIALAAAAAASGASRPQAAELANAAAGIVVGKLGTAVASPAEILGAVRRTGKLATLPEALDQVRRWRLQGLTIGFTNGCFDLFHPGHAALLAFARERCDRLVVGLNDDGSVRRLKGTGRPVQDLEARAAVLSAVAAVDVVLPFTADTPIELVHALRPDLLVKGADYRIEEVVGAEFVRGYGGAVALAPLKEGHSSSATIARLAETAAR